MFQETTVLKDFAKTTSTTTIYQARHFYVAAKAIKGTPSDLGEAAALLCNMKPSKVQFFFSFFLCRPTYSSSIMKRSARSSDVWWFVCPSVISSSLSQASCLIHLLRPSFFSGLPPEKGLYLTRKIIIPMAPGSFFSMMKCYEYYSH